MILPGSKRLKPEAIGYSPSIKSVQLKYSKFFAASEMIRTEL